MPAATFDMSFRAALTGAGLSEAYLVHAVVAVRTAPAGQPDVCDGYIARDGTVYVELTQLTGGVQGDLCDQDSGFSAVWRAVTDAVLQVSELTCEWDIPEPEGADFDPELVNVEYSVGGGEQTVVGYLPSEADCAVAGGGWFFDDDTSPTKILACTETCDALQGDPDLKVDVKFGCDRVPALQ